MAHANKHDLSGDPDAVSIPQSSQQDIATVPPPASGDAYNAPTVVREAPDEIMDLIRAREAAKVTIAANPVPRINVNVATGPTVPRPTPPRPAAGAPPRPTTRVGDAESEPKVPVLFTEELRSEPVIFAATPAPPPPSAPPVPVPEIAKAVAKPVLAKPDASPAPPPVRRAPERSLSFIRVLLAIFVVGGFLAGASAALGLCQ